MRSIALALLLAACLCAQTATPAATPPCAAGTDVGYTYSGSAMIGYNSPLGAGVAAGTGFGVKIGTCSKAIAEVNIWSGLTGAARQTGYDLFTARFEYDLVKSGNWVFGGDGTVGGAQVTGASGTALFQGGAHFGYDAGFLLSKGKTSLFVIGHADYTYLTNPPVPNAARANYWFEVRKTFK